MCERLPFGRICPGIHKAKKKYHTPKAPLKFRSPCSPPETKHKWNPQPWSSRAEEIRESFVGPRYRVSKCLSLRNPRWCVEVNNADSFIDCRNSTFRRQVCNSCQINALFGRNSRPSTRVANFQMRDVAENVMHVLRFYLLQKQDVNDVFIGEVCQQVSSCLRRASIDNVAALWIKYIVSLWLHIQSTAFYPPQVSSCFLIGETSSGLKNVVPLFSAPVLSMKCVAKGR